MSLIALLFVLLAPIPKTPYEGTIAVTMRSPRPVLLLLKPDGKEVRRIELTDLPNLYTVKNSRNAEWALVTNLAGNSQVNNRFYSLQDGHLVKWDGSVKPKRIVEGRASLKWVLNRDATKAYGTEVDVDKVAMDASATKSWEVDLATGNQKPIKLPAGHSIIDISLDDATVVLQGYEKNQYLMKFVTTKDWKATEIEGGSYYPHGLSPDAGKVMATEYLPGENGGPPRSELVIFDRETKAKVTIPKPAEIQSISAYTYGADGKRIAFSGSLQERQDNGRLTLIYRIFVANADGTGVKKIYETTNGEIISDIDWR
jgi:hypothetical protein